MVIFHDENATLYPRLCVLYNLTFVHLIRWNGNTIMSIEACTRIYGIKNCTTVKKTFTWFEERNIPYEFHDYKKQGVPRDHLVAWCQAMGWKALLNTKGLTWRKLTPEQQDISTQSKALATMMEYPSVIRRPIVETTDGRVLVGFNPTEFENFVRP